MAGLGANKVSVNALTKARTYPDPVTVGGLAGYVGILSSGDKVTLTRIGDTIGPPAASLTSA